MVRFFNRIKSKPIPNGIPQLENPLTATANYHKKDTLLANRNQTSTTAICLHEQGENIEL
jgi:hypothetical protein